jgi:hypothetical protein
MGKAGWQAMETLTPRQAAAELHRLEGWQEALARRTSGIAWMIWGLATTGLFVTYDFFAAEWWGSGNPWALRVFPFLWIPWVVLGAMATRALWRSAALVAPRLDVRRGRAIVLMIACILAATAGLQLAGVAVAPPGVILAVLGAAYLVQGAGGIGCSAPVERWLRLGSGAVFMLVTAVVTLAVGDGAAARQVFSVAAPVTTALVLCGTGLYLSSRG